MSATWHAKIQASLAELDAGGCDPESLAFFHDHYQANRPCVIDLPSWPAIRWTLNELQARIGAAPVEVQTGRLSDPQYELRSFLHKSTMPFCQFVDEVRRPNGGNDVYMTAQNKGANHEALTSLWGDVGPLPAFLTQHPDAGFFWLGRDTITPLHHDETNNLMCQTMGAKMIRMFPPSDRDRLDPSVGVHSHLGWVTDRMISDRGLSVTDIWLNPGQALFLPIGWWHCVMAFGTAITIVYTNFIWQNFWGRVTD